MKTTAALAAIVLSLVASFASPSRAAEPKVEELVVGPGTKAGRYILRPKGVRVAHIASKETRIAADELIAQKRKDAYDAKVKARTDALAARKKAAEDAAAARAAAKQKE